MFFFNCHSVIWHEQGILQCKFSNRFHSTMTAVVQGTCNPDGRPVLLVTRHYGL